jgi:hypothetical protein
MKPTSKDIKRGYDYPDLFREDTLARIELLCRDVAEHQRKIQELLQKVKPERKSGMPPRLLYTRIDNGLFE